MSEDCHDSNSARGEQRARSRRYSALPAEIRKDAFKKLREAGFTEPIHPDVPGSIRDMHTHRPGEHCQGCEDLYDLESKVDKEFLKTMGIKAD